MINPHPTKYPLCYASSPMKHQCTRENGHPGSHMANAIGYLAAIWDGDLFFGAGEWQ